MEIADAAALSGFAAVAAALTGAIKVLWNRSEECRVEHKAKDLRIDTLEERLNSCPAPACPNRAKWTARENATTSGPREPLPPHPHGLPTS